mgnify:CR=1 FL=1
MARPRVHVRNKTKKTLGCLYTPGSGARNDGQVEVRFTFEVGDKDGVLMPEDAAKVLLLRHPTILERVLSKRP